MGGHREDLQQLRALCTRGRRKPVPKEVRPLRHERDDWLSRRRSADAGKHYRALRTLTICLILGPHLGHLQQRRLLRSGAVELPLAHRGLRVAQVSALRLTNGTTHTFSANFHHLGAPKLWYGLAPSQRKLTYAKFGDLYRLYFDHCPQEPRHKRLFTLPAVFEKEGIEVTRIVQRPGMS